MSATPSTVTAFTLIEILITLAVVMVIGSYTSVFFSRFVTSTALSNAQDVFAGQARKAQLYAMVGQRNGAWGIRFGSSTLTMFQGASYAARDVTYDETNSINANIGASGPSEVVFAKRTGLPSTGPTTITLTSPIGNKTVTINSHGIVSR